VGGAHPQAQLRRRVDRGARQPDEACEDGGGGRYPGLLPARQAGVFWEDRGRLGRREAVGTGRRASRGDSERHIRAAAEVVGRGSIVRDTKV
jgi:hypothetical protein